MKRFAQFLEFLSLSILLISCGGGGGGGGGSSGVGGGNSNGSNGTNSAQNYVQTYTSTDAANGYFNINGGQYQTITFSGSQQGGTVTLTDGIGAELSGTYGEETFSRSSANQTNAAYAVQSRAAGSNQLKGYFWVRFNDLAIGYGYTWSVMIVDHTIVIRGQALDGSVMHYAGTSNGTSITPGSAEDPFNGTSWAFVVGTIREPYIGFENGEITGPYVDRSNLYDIDYNAENATYSRIYNRQNNYMVCRTSAGYKAYIMVFEISEAYSTNVNYTMWGTGWWTFTIENENATTGIFGVEAYTHTNISGDAQGGASALNLEKI